MANDVERGGEEEAVMMDESLNRLENATVFDRFTFVLGVAVTGTLVMFISLYAPCNEYRSSWYVLLILLDLLLEGVNGEEGVMGLVHSVDWNE